MRDEVLSVMGPTGTPTLDDLNNLPYLSNVVKEVGRITPTIWMFSRTPVRDIQFGDITLPKGCRLQICIEAMHKLEEYFERPNDFLPDRWENEDEWLVPGSYLPFGDGSHRCKFLSNGSLACVPCLEFEQNGSGTDHFTVWLSTGIGERFAILQIKTFLIHILREFEILEASKPSNMDDKRKYIFTQTLVDHKVRFKRRVTSAEE